MIYVCIIYFFHCFNLPIPFYLKWAYSWDLFFWFSLTGFSSWCICIIYIECNCWYVWIKLCLLIIFLFVPLFLIPLFPLSCLPLYCMDVYYIILTIVFFTIFLCFGGCSGNYSLHNFLQFYLEVIFYHLEKNIQILPPYPLSSPTLWCSCGLCIISINSHQAVLYILLSTDIHRFENLRGKNSFLYLPNICHFCSFIPEAPGFSLPSFLFYPEKLL